MFFLVEDPSTIWGLKRRKEIDVISSFMRKMDSFMYLIWTNFALRSIPTVVQKLFLCTLRKGTSPASLLGAGGTALSGPKVGLSLAQTQSLLLEADVLVCRASPWPIGHSWPFCATISVEEYMVCQGLLCWWESMWIASWWWAQRVRCDFVEWEGFQRGSSSTQQAKAYRLLLLKESTRENGGLRTKRK